MNDLHQFVWFVSSECGDDSFISKPSKRRSTGINIPGRLENGGEAKAPVLEYGGEI